MSRHQWSAIVLASALALCSRAGYAQAPLLTDSELAAFLARTLPASSAAQVAAALGAAGAALRAKEHIDLGAFRVASTEAAECVMQRASDRRLDIAQLFTDSRFAAGGGLAIVMDRQRLIAIDRIFDLHSLFPIAATTTDGRVLHMLFLLVGNGRLIVGYDGGATFEHKEAAFHIYGGKYDLQPVIRMSIEGSGSGQRAFSGLATLPRLDGTSPFGDFIGPMGSKLRALLLKPDGVAVKVELPWWALGIDTDLRVRVPAIARRRALTVEDATALHARGCPIDVPWGPAS